MKIFIENPETFEFLTQRGRWTNKTGEAANFPSSANAKVVGAATAIGLFNIIGYFASDPPQIVNMDDGAGKGKPVEVKV